jgi:hypothetical protein
MNTRLLFLYTLITFSVTTTMAQDYHPMPTGPARWDIARCWYFYPAGWYDRYYVEMDGSDTILNGQTYKKLWHTTHHAPGTEFDSTYTHFMGGMREADRKVYMFSEYLCLDTIARVIYDFNADSIGDTIYTQVLTNGLTQFIPHIVTDIDTVIFDFGAHRQLVLQDESGFFTETWTEGVGSSMGLPYASYWLLTDNSYDLNCMYINDNLAYHNPSPAYAFCTAPFPLSECEPIISSTDEGMEELAVSLFPNPTTGSIHLLSDAMIHSVMIFNAQGMNVAEFENQNSIDVVHLPGGVYFALIRNERSVGLTRFIKL